MEIVDELCLELEKATRIEERSNNDEYCLSRHMKFACSRPKGHLGLHIALGNEIGMVMLWHENLSDKGLDNWITLWKKMEKTYPD